jgi:hypothetical protein
MTGHLDQQRLTPLRLKWSPERGKVLRLEGAAGEVVDSATMEVAHRVSNSESLPVTSSPAKAPLLAQSKTAGVPEIPASQRPLAAWWSRLIGRVGVVEGGRLVEFRGGPRAVVRPKLRSRVSASLVLLAGLLLGSGSLERGLGAQREVSVHTGMANASAVAVLSDALFCAANDEDNVLRIYRLDVDGPEIGTLDVTSFLAVGGRSLEVDLEGAARVGDLVYWIGSHARNKDGKSRPNRQRLFATQIVTNGASAKLVPHGRPCSSLLDALVRNPSLERFGLKAAASRPPEDRGLNIESLAAGANGELWLGFRSPVLNGKALLVPLLNPADVLQLGYPKFGDPVELDLEGLGVRDMAWTGQEWFLIGGRAGSGGNARLFRWAGGKAGAERVEKAGFKKFNPEALAAVGTGESLRLLVLSDDGNASTALRKQFRSFWVTP